MKFSLLTPADYVTTTWKNGRGETTELAIWPPDATIENFGWRISSATVSEDAEFSIYAGYTRFLAVIKGDGLILELPQGEKRIAKNQVFEFDGAEKVYGRLRGGAVRDLNLILKNPLAGEMRISPGPCAETLRYGISAVIALSERVEIRAPQSVILKSNEIFLVHVEKNEMANLEIRGSDHAYALVKIHY